MAKLGVVRAQFLVGVAVAVDHGQAALVVLLADQPAGVHAECAHLVFKGVGIVDQFGFVEVLGEVVHHRVGHLDAHADVHFVVVRFDVVLLRHLRKATPRRRGRGRPPRSGRAPAPRLPSGPDMYTPQTRPSSTSSPSAVVRSRNSKPGRASSVTYMSRSTSKAVLRAQMAHRAGDELYVVREHSYMISSTLGSLRPWTSVGAPCLR